MSDVPVLPKLSAQNPIVEPSRKPTSNFLEFMERTRKAVTKAFADIFEVNARQDATDAELIAVNARQDATDASLQDQIDRINRILAGTEEFTGLNISGTDVSPFLEKTDGERLVDADGLEDLLVPTGKIEANAATETLSTYDATSASINGSGEKVLRSQAVTLLAGEKLAIQTSVSIYAVGKNGAAIGQLMSTVMLRIYRDSTMIYEAAASPTLHQVPIPVVVSPPWEDNPGPGTYTYETRVEHTASGDVSASTASSKFLSLTRVKL